MRKPYTYHFEMDRKNRIIGLAPTRETKIRAYAPNLIIGLVSLAMIPVISWIIEEMDDTQLVHVTPSED